MLHIYLVKKQNLVGRSLHHFIHGTKHKYCLHVFSFFFFASRFTLFYQSYAHYLTINQKAPHDVSQRWVTKSSIPLQNKKTYVEIRQEQCPPTSRGHTS